MRLGYQIQIGDCVEVMREMPESSVDAVVCDPPAGISFMGKSWDSDRGSRNAWIAWLTEVMKEALRIMKPGAHGFVWALPRTSHWTGMALEDAGFEVRERMAHHFGSGFPKSKSLRDIGMDGWGTALKPSTEDWWLIRKPLSESSVARNVLEWGTGGINVEASRVSTDLASEPDIGSAYYAKRGQPYPTEGSDGSGGSGATFVRPAHDRSLQSGGRWPPNLLLSHSEGCRPTGERRRVKGSNKPGPEGGKGDFGKHGRYGSANGRHNGTQDYTDPDGYEEVEGYECHPSCPILLMDGQSGQSQSSADKGKGFITPVATNYGWKRRVPEGYSDSGGASRFFPQFGGADDEDGVVSGGNGLRGRDGTAPGADSGDNDTLANFTPDTHPGFKYVAKASRRERNAGLEGMPETNGGLRENGRFNSGGRSLVDGEWVETGSTPQPKANSHPTVKPLALMDWLITLITPPGGTVLDPFAGSGSTGCSAVRLGFNFIGIEKEAEYAEIARRRIAYWSQGEPKQNGSSATAPQSPKPESSERLQYPATLF